MRLSRIAVPALIILAVCLSVVLGFKGLAQRQQSTKMRIISTVQRSADSRTPSERVPGEVNQLPVADYASAEQVDEKRKARNERYKGRFPFPFNTSGSRPIVSTAHWWEGLSALPADRSDAVVVGDVIDAQAFVANDRKGVYSEFTIKVEEVLKGKEHRLAGSITVEREGGAVQFPDGRINTYRVQDMGMPRIGARYVFFLEKLGGDYSILTGYELHEGKVYVLDGYRGNLMFIRYANYEAEAFLQEVKAAITQPSQTGTK